MAATSTINPIAALEIKQGQGAAGSEPVVHASAGARGFGSGATAPKRSASSDEEAVMRPASSIRDRFGEFFAQRAHEKNALYTRVVSSGYLLCGVGVLCGVCGLAVWYTGSPDSAQYSIGALMAVIGTFGFSCGVCLLSVVPTAEFHLDEQRQKRPVLWARIQFALGFVCIFVGTVFGTFFPYVTSAPLLIDGIVIMLHGQLPGLACCRPVTQGSFAVKVAAFPFVLFIPTAALYFVCGLNPERLTDNLVVPDLWESWVQTLRSNSSVIQPLYTAVGLVYVIAPCFTIWYCLHTCSKPQDVRPKGWTTRLLYSVLHSWMIAAGIGSAAINITAIYNSGIVFHQGILPSLAVVATVMAPPLLLLVVGPRRSFSLVARRFEFDICRLQQDGSLMAELAARSSVTSSASKHRWVFRRARSAALASARAAALKSDPAKRDYIDRSFWVLGELVSAPEPATPVSPGAAELRALVRMAEDQDHTWRARYRGRVLAVEGSKASANAGGGPSPRLPSASRGAFEEWVAETFAPDSVVRTDPSEGSVVVTCGFDRAESLPAADLLSWACANLRAFKWDKFSDDLLLRSPRELLDEVEKARVYALSVPVTVSRNADRIDMFLSHSWEDDATKKCAALRRFIESETAARGGKTPSLWFDKTCIDQANPGNALAVLPINVGACKQVVIVMSDSYLRRMWCVWELFSIFTFCYKELAVERIRIVALNDGDDARSRLVENLRSFSIDQAHCFDPNEESKLRNIIHDVGVVRLQESLEVLADSLR